MRRNLTGSTIFTLLLVVLLAPSAHAASFLTSLRMGDTSADVQALQQFLNTSTDTQVALSGVGSPGDESTYFGAKTLAAVKKFQTKYSADILAPAGLTMPTGIVGPMTLQKLRSLTLSQTQSPAAAPTLSLSLQQIQDMSLKDTATTSTPAQLQEIYIAKMWEAGKEQGYSSSTMMLIENAIRKEDPQSSERATQQFFDHEREVYFQAHSPKTSQSLLNHFLGKAFATIEDIFSIQKAQAVAPVAPFGGFITYINPVCNCPATVVQILVTLPTIPPPISNITLDYIYGSEAFRWYNIPEPGIATLGLETPGLQTCLIATSAGCIIVPAFGTITPIVGSSLVP